MNIGKSIAYGLAFYTVIGLAIGVGIFMGIMMSEDTDEFETFFLAIFSIIIFLGSGPVVGSIIGLFQGAASRDKPLHAAGAGFITGPVGFIIAAIIIFMLMVAAISIKYPSEEEEDPHEDEEVIQDAAPFFKMVAQILVPISLCCGLGAFITAKALSDPGLNISKKRESSRFTPTGISELIAPPAPQQTLSHPQQQYQTPLPMINCPNCGRPTSAQGFNCANCGTRIR